MRRGIAIIVFAVLLAASSQTAVEGQIRSAQPVQVPSRVVLRTASFTLDNLLPASAPAALHHEAMSVVLGKSPQPGASRVLYRQQMQFLLHGHASLLAALQLPRAIIVRRFHRPITRKEIVQAIQKALGRQGVAVTGPLDAESLHLSVPVYVTSADPGLQVLRIAADPARHETEFTLWTSKEPENLPFVVTLQRALKLPTLVARRSVPAGEIVSTSDFAVEMRPAGQTRAASSISQENLAGLETRAGLRAGQPVALDQFKRPILVRPGALATLIVRGSAFSIKTIVDPLEQGVLGQEIRVRNSETRQVVEAKVVGRDRLLKTM